MASLCEITDFKKIYSNRKYFGLVFISEMLLKISKLIFSYSENLFLFSWLGD